MNDDNFLKIGSLFFVAMAISLMVYFYFFLVNLEKQPKHSKPPIGSEYKKSNYSCNRPLASAAKQSQEATTNDA
jgi:hypothetical protein